jgi:hypothetical protein
MDHYRAIVSIEFDDEELEDIFGPGTSASEAVNGELDNLTFGSGWVEQIFRNKKPLIAQLSGGISVEISDFD